MTADAADVRRAGAITTIVFDMTGVITRSPLDELDAYGMRLGLPSGAMRGFFRTEAFRQVLLGRLHMDVLLSEIVSTVEREYGERASPHELRDAMRVARQIEPHVAALVKELVGRYQLAVLTNNTSDVVDPDASGSPPWWVDDSGSALSPQDFTLVMSSSDLGVTKPDPRIYVELLRRLGVQGHEVVYIDDQESNLAAATALGMRTIHYRNAEQCRDALRQQGVTVADRPADELDSRRSGRANPLLDY